MRRGAPAGSAAALVVRAGSWSPSSHELFPDEARARAVQLCRLGYLLSHRFCGEATAFVDCWMGCVLPWALRS